MFILPITLRWADFDPNFHLRHSVYYDFGATCRMAYLHENGLSIHVMEQLNFGPILFREEAFFRREVRMGDELTISLSVTKLRRDYSRFSFRHEIVKKDGTVSAILNIDGAWMDTKLRKLTVPPSIVAEMSEGAPKSADFEWV